MLYRVVTSSSKKLRVREKPSINSNIVGHLYKDIIYDCEPFNNKWVKVKSADTGIIGYASSDYLELHQNSNTDVTITFTKDELKTMLNYITNLLEG